MSVPLPALLLLFVGSGAAALIYETVWLQLLQLVIGSSAVSVGVLLGTFMGGMCLGSLWLPRAISDRRHPLRVYALLELGVGACGLVLLIAMPLVGRVYFAAGGGGAGGFLARGIVAAVCLLPPTVLMGATLPAVSRWIETTPEGVSRLGWFYAGNIAGAVCGCLRRGLLSAALLRHGDGDVRGGRVERRGGGAGVGRWRARSVRLKPDATPDMAPVASGFSRTNGGTTSVYVAIALSGFAALAGEVIWTRQIGLLFGATVYTFSIILAAFLIGLGGGSAAGSVLGKHMTRPRVALACCQLLAAAAIAWTAHKLTVSFPYWPITPDAVSRLQRGLRDGFRPHAVGGSASGVLLGRELSARAGVAWPPPSGIPRGSWAASTRRTPSAQLSARSWRACCWSRGSDPSGRSS